jgi:autotransporter family porin
MQSPEEQKGAYLDAWLQAARFDNEVHGDALAVEKYKSKSLSGSVEAGYAFPVYEGENSSMYIEPQAQVIYTDYKMDGDQHREVNGTVVTAEQAGGVQTRLGVRAYGHGNDKTGNRVQPFVAANWIRNARELNSVWLDDTLVAGGQPRDVYEAKAGVQMQAGGGWTGWGELNATRGKNDYQNYGAQLGVKYSW